MHQGNSLLSCRRDSPQDNVTHVLPSTNSLASSCHSQGCRAGRAQMPYGQILTHVQENTF